MDMELAEMIIEAIENNGMEAELRSGYSSWNMGSESTHGVVLEYDFGNVMAAIINNADIFVNEDGIPVFADPIKTIRSDAMEFGIILY